VLWQALATYIEMAGTSPAMMISNERNALRQRPIAPFAGLDEFENRFGELGTGGAARACFARSPGAIFAAKFGPQWEGRDR